MLVNTKVKRISIDKLHINHIYLLRKHNYTCAKMNNLSIKINFKKFDNLYNA